ncbi:MAG: hypothetical protein WBM48_13700, partial [Polyangiales bacterium]
MNPHVGFLEMHRDPNPAGYGDATLGRRLERPSLNGFDRGSVEIRARGVLHHDVRDLGVRGDRDEQDHG